MSDNYENEISKEVPDNFKIGNFEDAYANVFRTELTNSSNDETNGEKENETTKKIFFNDGVNHFIAQEEKGFIDCSKEDDYKQKKSSSKLFEISEKSVIDPTQKRARKDIADLKRKKIKSNFNRNLIIWLNNLLKGLNIHKKFFNFSQVYITDVTKKFNKRVMNMTLKEHILDDSFKYDKNMRNKDIKCYESNKKTISYLENKYDNSVEIMVVLNKKVKDIYIEYFQSTIFEKSIERLIKKDNTAEYIYNYRQVANDFVDYYS